MANEQNLIPLNKRSKKEQREIQSKGGRNSGAKRRQIKSFREAAECGLAMTANANVNGEQMQVTQYQRIIIMLLSMLNDPEDKRFFQAAQMLAQFRSSGYVEEKMLAEIERIKAETKRLQGDTEQHNGMLEDLIKGLQSDVHTGTDPAAHHRRMRRRILQRPILAQTVERDHQRESR